VLWINELIVSGVINHSRKNISRHLKLCKKMVDVVNGPEEKSRSRSSSRDTGCSGSISVSETRQSHVMQYSPTNMSTMLMSVIQEAVQALLEQHSCYDVSQLTAYLQTYYPEIPENFRAPVVIAATTAARQAAQFHYVWRDNYNSPDGHKRHYAASAASSLSFWALGLRSASRSGNAYVNQESSSVAVHPSEVTVTASALSSTVTSEAVEIPESSASVVRCLEFPVAIDSEDSGFNQLFGYYQGQTQNPLLSPIVSLVESGVAPIVSTLSPEVTDVAPFTTGMSGVPTVPAQLSEIVKVHVDPVSDIGAIATKETAAQTTALAMVRQDVAETLDADNTRNLRDLEEPLVIHAPSKIEDSTPPVMKLTACLGGQEEMSCGSQARGVLKSPVSYRRATSGHQRSPGKRHQGSSEVHACSFQKRRCALQQQGRSPPRSSRPPNRNRREDRVTLSAQEYEGFWGTHFANFSCLNQSSPISGLSSCHMIFDVRS